MFRKKTPGTFDPRDTKRARALAIEKAVLPKAARMFALADDLQSAVMGVAQYWDDEANDAVHHHLFYSAERDPDWQRHFVSVAAPLLEEDEELLDAWRMAYGFPTLEEEASTIPLERQSIISELVHAREGWNVARLSWDANGWAIPLFAAFCEEGANQDMVPRQAFTPYAVLRREDDEISVDVVGTMVRPWLDGVPPERGANSQLLDWVLGSER